MQETSLSIGLINPKSPENVDSVMRAAGNFQVDSVFYTGKRYVRAVEYKERRMNIARKVSKHIPLRQTECLIASASERMQIVCVELVVNAIPLPEYQHPAHACYIFGPEDGSIAQDVIDKADAVVYIPTVGCMNLAATVSVLLYDRAAKLPHMQQDNDLIRTSRDTNNRLAVKR